MKEIRDELVRNDWVLRRGGGHKHSIWACPCGEHLLTLSASSSSSRDRNNVKTAIRRCRRSAE